MDNSRKIRIILGIVIIAAGLISKGSWWIIGILPLFTGISNKCPSFFGQSTCNIEPTKKKEAKETHEEDNIQH